MVNDMTRVEAYHILGKMWEDATPEQAEAISMAQNDIQFVDLMPDDMVAVVRCKDCRHCLKDTMGIGFTGFVCEWRDDFNILLTDFCPYGERKDGDDHA